MCICSLLGRSVLCKVTAIFIALLPLSPTLATSTATIIPSKTTNTIPLQPPLSLYNYHQHLIIISIQSSLLCNCHLLQPLLLLFNHHYIVTAATTAPIKVPSFIFLHPTLLPHSIFCEIIVGITIFHFSNHLSSLLTEQYVASRQLYI